MVNSHNDSGNDQDTQFHVCERLLYETEWAIRISFIANLFIIDLDTVLFTRVTNLLYRYQESEIIHRN